MKQFYQSSYYVWIITKFIFCLAALISAIQILRNNNLKLIETIANLVAIIYGILMITDSFLSLNGNYYKSLKYVIGSFSIILGLIIFIVLIKIQVISIQITLLFILWVTLLGGFDLLQIKRNKD